MALFLGALTLPVIAKVGMTKGARFVPVVGVVLFLLVFVSFGEGGPLAPYVPDIIQWFFTADDAILYLIAGLCIGSLVLYAISLIISIKLYQTREF